MLTDTKCRTAPPREKLYRLSDSKGLYLEVKPNGVKAWRYRFELAGKESLFGIENMSSRKPGNRQKRLESVAPVDASHLRKLAMSEYVADTLSNKVSTRQNTASTFNSRPNTVPVLLSS